MFLHAWDFISHLSKGKVKVKMLKHPEVYTELSFKRQFTGKELVDLESSPFSLGRKGGTSTSITLLSEKFNMQSFGVDPG